MKAYLLSLGVGLLAGALYALLNVRSPAPPVIALLGLLGMLIGEQAVSRAKSVIERRLTIARAAPERWLEPADRRVHKRSDTGDHP